MSKVNEIIEGWSNLAFKKENVELLAKERLKICMCCKEHSKFHSSIRLDDHCTKCGCTLAAKTRSPESECPIGLWKAVNFKNNGDTEKQ